jgi:hypothetical protein
LWFEAELKLSGLTNELSRDLIEIRGDRRYLDLRAIA